MKRILIKETLEKVGQDVKISGWVRARRDHGTIIFLDIEDESHYILQAVFAGTLYERVKTLDETKRHPAVVSVEGRIVKRPAGMVNKDIPTGEIEIQVKEWEAINLSEPLPLPTNNDGYEVGEDVRLTYRYLDLRRDRLRRNLKSRHLLSQFIRNYLTDHGFIEVETPYLSKSTPEGARDYVVPSRLHHGQFYALPQSPQQYKQLLMIARIGKYFQIVRCFRDEDTRADRQPEFTQLDLEIPFATKEIIFDLIEDLYTKAIETVFPGKHLTQKPFPQLKYEEVMKKYKSDKPDLRKNKNDSNELAFCFVYGFPMFEKKEDGSLGAVHHPFTLPTFDTDDDPEDYQHDREKAYRMRGLLQRKNPEELLTLKAYQYDVVCNGYEIGGGSIRIYEPFLLRLVFEALGYSEPEVKNKFGHILEAFSYGVPPHGGIAMGLDRFIAILNNEQNIREVIAFPKTGDARDLMMDAPSQIDEKQLKELNLKIAKPER